MLERNNMSDRWMYFFLGGVFGAATLLFVSPKTRETFSRKAEQGKQRVREELKRGQEKIYEGRDQLEREAKGLVERARDFTNREKEIIRKAIEAGMQAYKEQKVDQRSDSFDI
ncbi:MAG: YtxH domain-containing protein [Desulfobacteraceae bacterium]|nr:MAG: YtxH domain-containing protein [Desulfobacteraceae bacterium]